MYPYLDTLAWSQVDEYLQHRPHVDDPLDHGRDDVLARDSLLLKLNTLVTSLHAKRKELESMHQKAEGCQGEEDKAKLYSLEVSTAMSDVRSVVDELESMVGDDYWPLPKYREMLFFA